MSTKSTLIILGVLAVAGLAIFWRPASEPASEENTEETVVDAANMETADEVAEEADTTTDTTTPTVKTTPRKTTPAPIPAVPEEKTGLSTYLTINYDQDATYAPKAFVVEEGAHVVMRITSSRTDTVTISGLGLSVPVVSDVQSTLEFDAETLGNFTIKLQEFGFTLGAIQVVAAD